MYFSELKKLFGGDEFPVIISDSQYLLESFASYGFITIDTNKVCENMELAPINVVLIPAIPSIHPNFELRDALKNSAVLLIPLLAFSYDRPAIEYLIERLKTLDFSAACKQNKRAIEFVQHVDVPINVLTDGCALTIELGNNPDVFAPKLEPSISKGEWISIIQFLEIGLVPNEEDTSFNVNGKLSCNGVSIAHHLHAHYEYGSKAEKAWDILNNYQSNGKFPIVLEIKNSKMIAIFTNDGENILEHIKPFTDEVMQGRLTEVAFGSLELSNNINWSINSQLNEPAGGVHIALGAGETGAHIDFVSSKAIIEGI